MENEKKELKRLFIAIPLPEDTLDILDIYISKYREKKELKKARWTPLNNLHITALFLGNVLDDDIPKIEEAMKQTLCNFHSFDLFFDRITFFPNNHYPHMIWVEYKKDSHYSEIVSSLQKAIEKVISLKKEDRDSIPHVTLARLKHVLGANKVDLIQVDVPVCNVKECLLMQSELSNEKPIYTILSRVPLGE